MQHPRGLPEAVLLENPESGKLNTPEVSPSVVPRMALRPLTENAPRANPVAPCDPERKWPEAKIAHPCVCLSENPKLGNPLTPASTCGKMGSPQNSAPPLSPCP